MPWDVIHFETVSDIPAGTRSVLFKYQLNGPQAGPDACSIYSVRMEASSRPKDPEFVPMEVTFAWSEIQRDYSLVKRSHTQLVTELPFKYDIHVGGSDHPVVNELRIGLKGTQENVKYGYSDGIDAGGDRHIDKWVTYGRNWAAGKPYTVSVPSKTNWEAGDPQGTKLTDGIMGPPYAGGIGPRYAPVLGQRRQSGDRCGPGAGAAMRRISDSARRRLAVVGCPQGRSEGQGGGPDFRGREIVRRAAAFST